MLAFIIVSAASCARQPEYPAPPIVGREAVIDAAALRPEVPAFFTFLHQGKKVGFFVLRSGDATSAFLDACVTCYSYRRGYRYDEGFVTCRYCSTKFPVMKLEKGIGGCYPIKIAGRLEEGKYRIALETLEKAADRF